MTNALRRTSNRIHISNNVVPACPAQKGAPCHLQTGETTIIFEDLDRDAIFTYVEIGENCTSCDHWYFPSYVISGLDALLAAAPDGFREIPEYGYQSSIRLEVYSFLRGSKTSHITLMSDGMCVELGPPSEFLCHAAAEILAPHVDPFHLEQRPSIKITPPPPYGALQEATIHMLLARIQLKLDEDHDDDGRVRDRWRQSHILKSILKWDKDPGRKALTLAMDLHAGTHPGDLVNAYRLLECVVDRLIDAEIASARWDVAVADDTFRTLATAHTKDFKTKILERVKRLGTPPESILTKFWSAAVRTEYEEKKVFEEIVKFRNRYVHQLETGKPPQALPWNRPDYEAITSR